MVELQRFLSDESPLPGIRAIPGRGTHVPLYILGSSLFGAVIAGVGVIAGETAESAAAQFEAARRIRARALFGRGQKLSEEEITALHYSDSVPNRLRSVELTAPRGSLKRI